MEQNAAVHYFDREFRLLGKKIDMQHLETLFPKKWRYPFTIVLTKGDKCALLCVTMGYCALVPSKWTLAGLPMECSQLIYEYAVEYIEVDCKLDMRCFFEENNLYSYPFHPLMWHLLDVRHNLCCQHDLLVYFKSKIMFHNNTTNSFGLWRPSKHIVEDVVSFFQSIPLLHVPHFSFII